MSEITVVSHTPGPWTAHVQTVWARADVQGERVIVADLYTPGLAMVEDAERQANARLIAAAPEMLDALRRIAENAGTVAGANNREALEIETWQDMARSAIAKAEGR